AFDDLDAVKRDPKPRRDDLREAGLMSLAVIVRAEPRLHGAVGLEADRGGFVESRARAERAGKTRGCDARGLDIAGDADAAQFSVARRRDPALRETGVIGKLQHPRQ